MSTDETPRRPWRRKDRVWSAPGSRLVPAPLACIGMLALLGLCCTRPPAKHPRAGPGPPRSAAAEAKPPSESEAHASTGAGTNGSQTGLPADEPPRCEFKLDGGRVRLVTERYEIALETGAMTSLKNLLTGETYTVEKTDVESRMRHLMHGMGTRAGLSEADAKELESMHQWAGGYRYDANWASVHHPSPESEVTIETLAWNHVKVTWRGLRGREPGKQYPDESYALDMEVLPGTGDLQIIVTTESDGGGVYGNGFLMAGFSMDLRFVLPETNGYSFVPDGKPWAGSTHWPQPWHAALVIGQGEKGSFGLSMRDPDMLDRYLHRRSNQDCYDIMFESVNQAPFDDCTRAVSRPIRINVYEGGWVRPAGAFREWWAKTFDVKPIDEREPKWLRDVAFACYHYELPPREMIPRTLLWAPQHWKVGPKVGDGGLFPYEIEKGPELDAMKGSLPAIKEAGGNVMVYLNINHMNEGHPWAKKYWQQRLVKPFGKRPVERDPRLGAVDSFQVNSAFRPWQDLIVWWADESYKRFGIKGFYLDCAVGTPNSLGGTIEGRNDCQGQVELMKRMKEKIPGCWLGVEYATEVTAVAADTGFVGYDSWWPGSIEEREKSVHPILGFLFNRYVHLWYCSGSNPVFDEVIGRLPHTPVRELDDRWVTDYCVSEEFGSYMARLRWKTGMKAVYPEDWEAGVRAYYAGTTRGSDRLRGANDTAGDLYKILADTPRESRMVKVDAAGREELVYWRIKDRSAASLGPGTGIDGWLAYDGDTAIGLNPAKAYLYTAGPRITDWEVVNLPERAFVEVSRPYRNGLLVLELGTPGGETSSGPVEILTTHRIALALGRDGAATIETLPREDERHRYRISATAPGTVTFSAAEPAALPAPAQGGPIAEIWKLPTDHYAGWNESGLREPIEKRLLPSVDGKGTIRMFPRWQKHGALDYLVELPAVPPGRKLTLKLGTLITPHEGNNVQFVVKANGREVLKAKVSGTKTENPTPRSADLTDFAGRKVLLSIQAWDCHLFNWLFLSEPVIVLE